MSPETKRRLWRQQAGLCPWCWQPIAYEQVEGITAEKATVDHKRPRAHGGTNRFSNLQLMHRPCNTEKGSSCEGCDFCAPEGTRIIELTLNGGTVRYRLVTEPEYHGQLLAQELLARLRLHGDRCRCKMCLTLTPAERLFLDRIPAPYQGEPDDEQA